MARDGRGGAEEAAGARGQRWAVGGDAEVGADVMPLRLPQRPDIGRSVGSRSDYSAAAFFFLARLAAVLFGAGWVVA